MNVRVGSRQDIQNVDSYATLDIERSPDLLNLTADEIASLFGRESSLVALHWLLASNELQQAALAALLGKAGRRSVRVLNADLTIPDYLRLLSRLCEDAAAQTEKEIGDSRESENGKATFGWDREAAFTGAGPLMEAQIAGPPTETQKIIFLGVVASNWAGTPVPCRFDAWADNNPLPHESGSVNAAPLYKVPAGTLEVKLTATPQASPSPFWEKTVFLTVGATGMTVKSGSEGFVNLKTQPFGAVPGWAAFANIVVSRFKDVTADILPLLSNPPATRHKYVLAGDVDPNTGTKYTQKGWVDEATTKEVANLSRAWKTWPPGDWDLDDLDAAHFIDPVTPVITSSKTLNFVRDQLTINAKSVVLELAGVDAPKLFGVAWPDGVPRVAGAKPTPFLLFLEQTLKGNNYDGFGQFVAPLAAYPDNFDYAFLLYQQLHYAGIAETPGVWTMPPTPFPDSTMKGVPYQVARAGANVVTVVPLVSFDKKYGVMDDTEETGRILEELQAFMFLSENFAPPTSVGNTAIAAFSNATHVLYKWLASEPNQNGNFLKNTVKAVYFLDPPRDTRPQNVDYDVNTYIAAALTWAAGGADKRIRLYNRDHSNAHGKLLGKAPPSAPYVLNSADGLKTAAELPEPFWLAALAKVGVKYNAVPDTPKHRAEVQFLFAHHMFAATMLTHALSQSGGQPPSRDVGL
jgi:hypothetical protein